MDPRRRFSPRRPAGGAILPRIAAPLRRTVAALMPSLKEELARLVAIPSVSALGYPAETRPALLEAYEEVARLFREAGVTILDPLELPDTAPVLMGEIPPPEGAPTVLRYCHYDVVPVGDEAKWESPPFEATERNGGSLMLPYVVVLTVAWTLFFVAWYLIGIPLGPGSPVHSG